MYYKIPSTLFFLIGNLVSLVLHVQSTRTNAKAAFPCDDPPPSSISITTNAPADLTICGSSQWSFDIDYTAGDLYQWKISDPAMGSIVAGKYTPNIEVLFNNVRGKANSVGIIVAITKCKEIKRDTLIIRVANIPDYTIITNAGTICAGEPLNFNITPRPLNYDKLTWGFGDGSTSHQVNAIHSYPNNDSVVQYKPVVTIVNPEGCLATAVSHADSITVNPSPIALLSPAGVITGCGSISNTLTATITNKFTDITNYDWHGPSVSNLPYCTNCSTWDMDQFDDYHVVVEDGNGCKGVSNTVSVVENCNGSNCPEPSLNESRSSILDCGIAQVNIKYKPNKLKITNETWTFPDEAINTRFTTGINATATASFTKPGIYPISYSVEPDGTCLKIFDQTVYVPFIGDMRYEVSCDSGNFYNIVLYDHSLIFPKEEGHIRYIYAYKEDGRAWKTITAPRNAQSARVQLPAANYQLREIIYSNLTPAAPPCTTLVELNLPAKPVAYFEAVSAFKPACVSDVAVHFNNLSYPATGLNYVWEFGDGSTNHQANTDKVFGSDFAGTFYWVTLTAINNYGCISTSGEYVEIMGNENWDGVIKPDIIQTPQSPQPFGKSITLSYYTFIYANPTKFVWYKGNKQLTTEVSSPNFEVTEPGLYWVMGSDQYGCMVPSNPVEVNFTEKSKTTIPP
ncbi:hypothetical protein G3O08_19245 [Cryomorpha ignava]|uniref:PKD domain-containing protein n=1 Tax=Cryomorpha ignava TaxID=101383 RepID=A0A7K3WVA3_9FLAO|nr:hypothetical protein [Cryomorpha ignava]NEN25633.1 hypothetical protein [Cryomorpha ignava]